MAGRVRASRGVNILRPQAGSQSPLSHPLEGLVSDGGFVEGLFFSVREGCFRMNRFWANRSRGTGNGSKWVESEVG